MWFCDKIDSASRKELGHVAEIVKVLIKFGEKNQDKARLLYLQLTFSE